MNTQAACSKRLGGAMRQSPYVTADLSILNFFRRRHHAPGWRRLQLTLQALPLNGKIVLRLPNSDAKNDAQRDQQTIREANDRRKTHGGKKPTSET
jgi:hypothetical protein